MLAWPHVGIMEAERRRFGICFIKTGKQIGPIIYNSSILHILTHVLVTKSLEGGYYSWSHFTEGKMETKKD